MDFLIKNTNILKQRSDCLILSLYDGEKQSEIVQALDQLTDNTISALIKSGDMSGKLGKTVVLYNLHSSVAKKVLFIGVGQREQFNQTMAKKVITAIMNQLLSLNVKSVSCDLLSVNPSISYKISRLIVEIGSNCLYRFDEYQSDKQPLPSIVKMVLNIEKGLYQQDAEQGLLHGKSIANAISATKTLANQPSNVCNARYLADKAKQLSEQFSSLKTHHYDEKALTKLGMNAYLAVGSGSKNESIMTVIEYYGAANKQAQPFVLVGKGLTFDSGGISIKPAASMDEMKYDMCGAATVYGVMRAIAELNLPINVVGVMAGCENMPSGESFRPGDILTTMSGKTVEVINTDAEGRLVLCDVLTFVEKFKPKSVIDIATLTGACVVALGHHYTGVMGNDAQLTQQLVDAANVANDKAWTLPMDDDFQAQIKSSCADIVNSSGRDGGTITAACFLSRFTENYSWAHLDIAGTAWVSGTKKGATGRPVAMLVQFLLDQSH